MNPIIYLLIFIFAYFLGVVIGLLIIGLAIFYYEGTRK